VSDKESCSKSHLTSRWLLKWLYCRFSYDILPLKILVHIFFYHGATAPIGPRPSHCQGFMITYTR
jgi:diadenosine tetraphosphatase ApaH/serine/threonine PP2A family protein phosphatase